MFMMKGKPVADKILDEVKKKIEETGLQVQLCLLAEDKTNPFYKGLVKDAEYCGIHVTEDVFQSDGIVTVDGKPSILWDHKNLDGGVNNPIPCVAEAVIELLNYYDIPLVGVEAVVIGRSNRVGKPIANLLIDRGCTITVLHRQSSNQTMYDAILRSDIIVSCAGNAGFDKTLEIRDYHVIVDVGGDFKNLEGVNCKIAPFIGGVGPITRALVMKRALARVRNFVGG